MKTTDSISAAAILLAGSILLSRILGYAREMALAGMYGAGPQTDAFYAAFQIPDLLNYFLSGGALSIAFIPLYNRVLAREGAAAAQDLFSVVLGTMGVLAAGAGVLLAWQAPALIALQFPKFDAPTAALTVELTRVVIPAQVFFIAGGIVQAVLLARRHFLAAALAPLVYNVLIIAGGVLLHGYCGIMGFAYGTLAGALLGPFLIPLLFARGHFSLRPRVAFADRRFAGYLLLAAPLMLGQSLLTLDEWYGRWFGALLPAGTVAHISYARRLMQAPVAVIGQAVAAAALPTLSKLWAEERVAELNRAVLDTLRVGLTLAVLAGAGMAAMALPLVGLVYHHGAFGAGDAGIVAALVVVFAFAVPGWIVQQIAVRAFYARGDTWRPMALGTALALAVIPLYLKLPGRLGVEGIALAGAAGMTLNALATLAFARRLHGAPLLLPLGGSFLRSLVFAVPAAAAAVAAMRWRAEFLPLEGYHMKWQAFADLCSGGAAFLLVSVPGILLLDDGPLKLYAKKMLAKILRRPAR